MNLQNLFIGSAFSGYLDSSDFNYYNYATHILFFMGICAQVSLECVPRSGLTMSKDLYVI